MRKTKGRDTNASGVRKKANTMRSVKCPDIIENLACDLSEKDNSRPTWLSE